MFPIVRAKTTRVYYQFLEIYRRTNVTVILKQLVVGKHESNTK